MFDKVLSLLSDFGFLGGSKKKGIGLGQHAEVCHKLILQLGYDDYGEGSRLENRLSQGALGDHQSRSMADAEQFTP